MDDADVAAVSLQAVMQLSRMLQTHQQIADGSQMPLELMAAVA